MFRKGVLAILAVLLVIFTSMHLYYAYTGGFNSSRLLLADQLEEAPPSVIGKEFYFLGHGHQTYAFISADQSSVLKLFKKDYLLRSWWSKLLPPVFPFRSLVLHKDEGKEYRRNRLLQGYRAAFEHDRENSALIAFHEKKSSEKIPVVLVDGLGMKHQIDLNDYVFAIQLKAKTTREELQELLSHGDVAQATNRLRQLIDLYQSSYRNGIYDEDHNVIDNTGFINNRAIRQDVGKIVWDPTKINRSFIQNDLDKVIRKRLTLWLQREYPKYSKELLHGLNEY